MGGLIKMINCITLNKTFKMWKSYKTYSLVIILFALCGCRHMGPYGSEKSETLSFPYKYETYAPIRESLSFENDCICVHTRYDIYSRDSIVFIDTCYWKNSTDAEEMIILQRKETKDKMDVVLHPKDTNLNFAYNICPNWYNISQWEFKRHTKYKSPLYQDLVMSLPLNISSEERERIYKSWHPTFEDKYGSHHIVYDTIFNYGSFWVWFKRPLWNGVLFPMSKPFKTPVRKTKEDGRFFEFVTNSYEYINYKVNYEKKNDFDIDSIIGRQYSYIGDPHKKESIQFINDSVCTHSVSTRGSVSSPFVSQESDSCRYSVKNNLIGIEFVKGKSCDTLTYSNGILFYSKVYRNDDGGEYTHTVKPFIDETRCCANKTDSINMIMSTYFSTYVPLNLYK